MQDAACRLQTDTVVVCRVLGAWWRIQVEVAEGYRVQY